MTKSTLPAANAGLPAIDRCSLVCGLGTAAIAGIPALASATPDDPVFQAMAALERLKIHAEEPDAAHSVAEDAVFAARKENVVTIDGEEMRTHEQIDAHFRPAFGPEDEEQLTSLSRNFARAICLPPNEPNATGRAKPLTTNWPGKKRQLPKPNSASRIRFAALKSRPPICHLRLRFRHLLLLRSRPEDAHDSRRCSAFLV